MHTGPTAHLLSKTGGPGPPSSHSGKDLFGYSAILIRRTQVQYLHGGERSFSHKELSSWPYIRLTLLPSNGNSSRDHYFSNCMGLKLNVEPV